MLINRIRKGLPLLPVFTALILFALRPEQAAAAAAEGAALCLQSVIPALLPFLITTNAVIRIGIPEPLLRALGRPFEKWFHIRRTALPALLLGLIGGCPVGAAAAVECLRRKDCSREEAERLVVFTNNCSPAFLLAVLGGKVLKNPREAVMLLLLQWMVSVYLGWLLGTGHTASVGTGHIPMGDKGGINRILTDSVKEGGRTCLLISAYVVFFSAVSAFLPENPLLYGMLELTGGILRLGGSGQYKTVAAAFLLGWGGLAVACQVMAVSEGEGIRTGHYLPWRFLHGALMALAAFCFEKSPLFWPIPLCFAAILAIIVKKSRKRGEIAV